MALTESSVIDVGSAANVLLLAPTMHAGTEHGCGSLLGAYEGRGDALLSVLTIESPEDMLRTWTDHVSETPPEVATFVVLGGDGDPPSDADRDESRIVHPIQHPSNLTDIGSVSSTYLSRWQQEDRSIVCCFRSITMLLQYVSNEVVYRFLHQFAQQVNAAGGVAHYHMDPDAHDPQVVNTLLTLFDAVVELDDEGNWQVRSRSLG